MVWWIPGSTPYIKQGLKRLPSGPGQMDRWTNQSSIFGSLVGTSLPMGRPQTVESKA